MTPHSIWAISAVQRHGLSRTGLDVETEVVSQCWVACEEGETEKGNFPQSVVRAGYENFSLSLLFLIVDKLKRK